MVISSRGLGSDSLVYSALAELVVTLISELEPMGEYCIVDAVCKGNTVTECPLDLRRDFERFRERGGGSQEEYVKEMAKMAIPEMDTSTIR